MACKLKRKFKSTALNRLNDILQGFVDSLEEETSFYSVLNVVVNRDHERELTYQLKIVENLVKSIREQVPDIQQSLTVCDEMFSLACGNSASQEDVMCTGSNVGVGGASNSNTESKAVNDRRLNLRLRSNTCLHVCSHHQLVIDDMLWKKLPREVVEHVCAFLPFSKTLELQELCELWSRMPMATTFRESCAKAHEDLFGILIRHDYDQDYWIAISNSKQTEWDYLVLKDTPLPSDNFNLSNNVEELFAHDGGLICILPNHFEYYEYWKEHPFIFVFNPLTGDKREIPVSRFTYDTEAVLLKLKVDSKTGCYEVVLVTHSGRKRTGAGVYCSERYDSKSKLWSKLDSGFVFGDGVIDNQRRDLYFDCCSKQLREYDGFRDPMSNSESVTFVKNHRFEIGFVDQVEDDRLHSLLKMKESIWENGWITRSTSFPSFLIEEPSLKDLKTRVLATQRYVLVVAYNLRSEVFLQRMLLYDRDTCKEVYEIPYLWKVFDRRYKFKSDHIQLMCDLKWNAVP